MHPELAAISPAPVALGERLYSRWYFKRVLDRGGVDIIQPHPSHAGGITETHKIAAMAEAYDVALALHCPLGPVAVAANLQLDTVCHNAFIQEQSLGIHYNAANDLLDYVADRCVFAYEDGYVTIPGGLVWASRPTKPMWWNARPWVIAGATRSGGMPTAASRNGHRMKGWIWL
jgi:galactonate dehydratase